MSLTRGSPVPPFILFLAASSALFVPEELFCPLDEVPFLEEATGRPRFCSGVVQCPIGYNCHKGALCCGKPGQCPDGETVATDDDGRFLTCSLSDQQSCLPYSVCRPSSTSSQYLCCTRNALTVQSEQITVRMNDCWRCDFSRAVRCGSGSPCPFNDPYAQLLCCPSSGIRRTPVLSCAEKNRNAEVLPNGQQRKCTVRNPICSNGYTCQASSHPNIMLCCSTGPSYSCPSAAQTPALAGNINIFCTKPGQTYVCPLGAICQTAANSRDLHICCYGNRRVAQQISARPECPKGRNAQSGSGGYVPCSMNSGSEECAAGYTCTQATNAPTEGLCCSDDAALEKPICPAQQKLLMSGNEPQYCSPNQPVACPGGYDCNEAKNQPDTYVCCTAAAPSACPSEFTPSLNVNGSEIYCTPNEPSSCRGGAVCMESVTKNVFLCCYSSLPHKVCPDSQDALILGDGQLEICGGAGSNCSQSGYTCQVSSQLSTWVCCGQPTVMAVCANGRETYYQVEGQTYPCDLLSHPTSCPVNYECAPSKRRGISVCCLKSSSGTTASTQSTISTKRTTATRAECPSGWNPYTNYHTGGYRYCRNVADMSCPTGFSCAHSTHRNIHMCCRFGSSLQCANGMNTLLVNNRPLLCSARDINLCPTGYSCQISTLANVRICCTNMRVLDQQPTASHFSSDIRCQHDLSLPAIVHNHYIRFCPTLGSYNGCPEGYICSSSTRSNLNVCCRSISRSLIIKVEPEEAVCGENGFAYQQGSRPLQCSQDSTNACPEHYVCQPSFTNSKMYCCREEPRCPSGVIPTYTKQCEVSADCSTDEECQEAENMEGVRSCCPVAIEEVTRCLGRETYLTNASPAACLTAASCPPSYECSNLTTTNEYACCKKRNEQIQICPDNRDPYRRFANDAPLYCDDTDFACPDGYLCKQSLVMNRFICCSPIGFCQSGRKPQLDEDTNQPKRCFSNPEDITACDKGFTCQRSTVKYIRVCCSSHS